MVFERQLYETSTCTNFPQKNSQPKVRNPRRRIRKNETISLTKTFVECWYLPNVNALDANRNEFGRRCMAKSSKSGRQACALGASFDRIGRFATTSVPPKTLLDYQPEAKGRSSIFSHANLGGRIWANLIRFFPPLGRKARVSIYNLLGLPLSGRRAGGTTSNRLSLVLVVVNMGKIIYPLLHKGVVTRI